MALVLQGPVELRVPEGTQIPPPAAIPKGTTIPVQLLNRLSTKTLKPGDGVYAMTIFPITLNNEIVIPVGSSVGGKVTLVERPGKVKGKAGMALSFQVLILPTGSTIPLYASLAGSSDAETTTEGKIIGESSKGEDAAKVAGAVAVPAVIGGIAGGQRSARVGAGVGAAAGLATVLLTRGKDIVLDKGTTLEIVLDRPLDL
jgi:type IV secretion system protein VirB10